MKKSIRLCVLIVVVALVLIPASTARGDAIPSPIFIGGSPYTTRETNVQMINEEVYISITDTLDATVQATFYMVNHGNETEAFDVWFPTEGMLSRDEHLNYFKVWVNGKPTETEETFVNFSKWKVWPVTFPPDQTVLFAVEYSITTNDPSIEYILETGAYWYGPIGAGTVTVELPFESNEYNTRSIKGPGTPEQMGSTLTWTFTDLEPGYSDNVWVWLYDPVAYYRINSALAAVAESPDSLYAHLELARAIRSLMEISPQKIDNQVHVERVAEAYQAALELAPDDPEVNIEYVDFLLDVYPFYLPDDITKRVERMMEVAPDDERAHELYRIYESIDPNMSLPTLLATQATRPLPTETEAPTETVFPSPPPTQSPTLTPAAPTAVPTPTPVPVESNPPERPIWPVAAIVGVVIGIGAFFLIRGRMAR
jgi:hypothetical protein